MLRTEISRVVSLLVISTFCTMVGDDDVTTSSQDSGDGHQQGAVAGRTSAEGPILKSMEQEVCGRAFAVTGTGAVWTFIPNGPPRFHKGQRVPATKPLVLGYDDDLEAIIKPAAQNRIAFFDQGKWHVLPWAERLTRHDRNGPYGRIVAGIDNTVLVVGDDRALLIQGTKIVDSGSVLELLKKHRDVIRTSFGLGVPYPIRRDRWLRHTMIVADKLGRIWCLHDNHLHVLVDDSWLECRESLVQAGSRHGTIAFIVPGPDHRYLYIGDNQLRHDGGVSFLAMIKNGDVVFEPTHHAIDGMGKFPALLEQNDAIWIASPEGKSGGVCDIFTGQLAVRIDKDGQVSNTLRMSGYPLLNDSIGNTWLGGIRGGPDNIFNIVREGKVVQKLEAPVKLTESGYNGDYLPVLCDSPGSAFVYHDQGFTHFVADEQSPHHYQQAHHYTLEKPTGAPQSYSSQGYCISLDAYDDQAVKLMYLTRLP